MIHLNGGELKAYGKMTLPFDLLGYCGHAATPAPKCSLNAFNKIAPAIEPDVENTSIQIKGEHNETLLEIHCTMTDNCTTMNNMCQPRRRLSHTKMKHKLV
jgi:hypothetical protein